MKIELKDAEEFRRILMIKGISQKELADAVEVAPSYISQITNDIRNPSPKVAKKITEFLKVDFEHIFFISNACKS